MRCCFSLGSGFSKFLYTQNKAVQLPLSDTTQDCRGGECVPFLERGWRSVAQPDFVKMSSVQLQQLVLARPVLLSAAEKRAQESVMLTMSDNACEHSGSWNMLSCSVW